MTLFGRICQKLLTQGFFDQLLKKLYFLLGPFGMQMATSFHVRKEFFNLLPNLQIEEMMKAFSVKSNDYMYVLYVSSLIKSVISLHNLINNKIHNKEQEEEQAKKEKEAEDEKKKKQEESAAKAEEMLKKNAEDAKK